MATYDWSKFGLHIPEMMLPKEGTDYFKWAVVACDQYTSEPEYWDKVEEIVGDSPSALRLMLPELYLDGPDEADRIKAVRAAMDKYLADGTLRKMEPGCMLIKRTAEGRTRMGLVIATDLEAYDFNKGSTSLTRATEGTVVERIPPRLRIRGDAPIEMPHIIILIDDPGKTVIEPLVDQPREVIYDTDLMMNGGHITGSFIKEENLAGMQEALSALYDEAEKKYGAGNVIFQAMGDGNHSLATAKTAWENIKKTLTPEEIEMVGKDVAMQVASMNPKFVDEDGVDPEYLESEKKILTEQVLNEGKKPEMVDRIVAGKIKKELKEVCLVDQPFVKNSDLSVKQYVDSVAKEMGKPMQVVSMVRYEVGEGIEKKEDDFAAEVAAAAQA